MDATGIIVMGACGRMGKRLVTLTVQAEDLFLAAAVECQGHPDIGKDVIALNGLSGTPVRIVDDIASVIQDGSVIIDFTAPASLLSTLRIATENHKSIVIGTTGITEELNQKINAAAKEISIVQATNMSMGVNVLFKLARETASILRNGYDVEILEMHHRHKKDAPSGTAVTLSEEVASARGLEIRDVRKTGREGQVGERTDDEIGVMAIRGGDIVGEHTVIFAGTGERLELTHRAGSRDTFASGALTAARFLRGKSSGRFTMRDVLNI